MHDFGYDENDDDALDNFGVYQKRARQQLVDATRKNLDDNLEKAELNKHEVFIVSCNVIFSLVTDKPVRKTTTEIHEVRLLEAFLKMAHARRYGTHASSKNHSTFDKLKSDFQRLYENSSSGIAEIMESIRKLDEWD